MRNKKSNLSFIGLFSFIALLSIFVVWVGFRIGQPVPCTDSIECPDLSSNALDTSETYANFHGSVIGVPVQELVDAGNSVLGESTDVGNKHIYVDLTNQRLYAKEGDRVLYDFSVSTGKWAPTPTGDYKIWTKLRYTRMTGGNPAIGTYYNLPNVPFTMYFYKGYGLHGTYWHNNFGHPMSHGCVNMRTPEAGLIFNWAPVGTPVTVYGVTPRS